MGFISPVHNTRTFLVHKWDSLLKYGWGLSTLGSFQLHLLYRHRPYSLAIHFLKSFDFFWYQMNLNYNYLFDMIMIMMLMPIHVGVPWLSFLASLSGSRAHRDTCVPPITELWKFLGFKHCSFHSLSLSYLLLLSPSWTFSRESSTPLPITQTWTLCTHPHQHNHAHPISVCNIFSCVWQKFTWQAAHCFYMWPKILTGLAAP